MNIKMLFNVLNNNFNDYELVKFKKNSDKHYNFKQLTNQSIILKNKYGIEFAHELNSISEIEKFSSTLKKRIERFKSLVNPTFIRLETQNLNQNQMKIYSQIELELQKIFGEFKIILISNIEYTSKYTHWIKLNNFDSDWRYLSIDWDKLIT